MQGSVAVHANGTFLECVRLNHTLTGEAPGDQFGWVSAPLSDTDGDGVQELLVTAPFHATGGTNSGRVYLYDGRTGVERFHVDGQATGERLGFSVRHAGDVNRDGTPDFIAGGQGSSQVPGVARVFSGADGSELLPLRQGGAGDNFGASVAPAGDVDQDGVPDLAVAAPGDDSAANNAGRVYVLSGADGSVLWTVDGEAGNDAFGSALASLGDVTDDGRAELAVGAANGGGNNRGLVYVYDLATRTELYRVGPDASGTNFGQFFVDDIGDANADGYPDLYVSDFAASGGRGKAYVFDGVSGDELWKRAGMGNAGFGIGRGVGDVDGDGRADLILAGWTDSSGAPRAGRAQICSGLDGSILRTITSTTANENFGFDAHGLGDVDGDGDPDYVVTAATFAGSRGQVYVIAGGDQVEAFGQGLAGSQGFVPELSFDGCPRPAEPFDLRISGALGGAHGCLVIGTQQLAVPAAGGTIYTNLNFLVFAHQAVGAAGVPGAGSQLFSLAWPNDPSLAGQSFFAQAAYFDAGAPRGVAFSDALRIRVF